VGIGASIAPDAVVYGLTDQSTTEERALSETVGIAGSGAIACGLAAVAAQRGPVVVWARSDDSAEKAGAAVRRLCEKAGANVNGNVHVTSDAAALAGASFVVEAIVEDPQAKAALMGRLGPRLADDAILATTTSSLSIGELAEASGRPDRFVGLHVFNPVPKMELVELSFPDAASERTRARARALCEALGKTPVEVPDTAGFVVNRLLFPFLFDAVRLMDRTGLDAEAIDTCMRLGAGHPLGPLALLDLVGLDVSAAIGRTIGVDVPERVERMIAAGALGRKAGRGFYDYE
jgi:3-hydroxybutyryl-CoA dehydrogenase